ncbi:MAG TPA: hypothetical protein VFW64_12455 [Pseudonocardiaceae bacterium]|nr:hypothetical protein [Pseudonocardiaceae bacterium]
MTPCDDDSPDTFFLVFPRTDDRRDGWVRIEGATRDEARTYAARRYGTDWAELVNDVCFNPDLYRGGELDAVRIEARS